MNEEAKRNRDRRKRVMLKRVQNKTGVAFVIVVAVLLVLSIKILMINYNKGEAYSKIVLDHQSYTSTTIPYKRGQIQDRNGTVLAYSEKVYNLILDPKQLLSDEKYKEPTLNALVQCFDLSREDLENILDTKSTSQYERLIKELTADEIAEFQELKADTKNNPNIKGVWFEESYVRKYPFSTLACSVIGFASAANGGELGLEKYYNSELSGVDGLSYQYIDEELDAQSVQKGAVDGYNIITTIDYKIQSVVEKKIRELNAERPSLSTSVIVMNPNNAEVLAMANYPDFDLNNPRDLSGLYTEEELTAMSDTDKTNALYSLWSNYCISAVIEPGSTFKSITVASALEEGVVKDGDTFECHGYEEMAGYRIECHSVKSGGHGTLTLKQALGESCNPALMQIGAKIGSAKFAKYERLFGFGSKTGIDLPGEEQGIVRGEEMSALDLACVAFGQNLNVTMIQMAAAYSSILNGGYYYQPHIVKRIEKTSGEVVKNIEPTLVKQTITAETSELMREYIRGVVEEGTAGAVRISGYDIGGKTGTAQKLPREDKKYIVSFIGAVPMDKPQYLLYVVVNEPYGTSGVSGTTEDARSLFREIFEELLPYMGVYKNTQETEEDISGSTSHEDENTVSLPEMGNSEDAGGN